mgnify:CR=1 FL=1
MRSLLALAAGLAIALAVEPTSAQPAGGGTAPPGQPRIEPPAVQRLEIRQDTPAERELFLQRRQQQLQELRPEQVSPLPAQRIEPARPTK